ESGVRRWAPGVTAETVLWAMWRATRLGEAWARTALDGGLSGARADRDLDAVVALFDAAARYVDRLPQMGPGGFLEHIRGQDVAGDTLVARAPSEHTVALVTAQGAAGREWRFVVVAGVQEGVWPDLRLRGSLLGSERLVDVLTGRGQSLRAAQAAVRYDETRAFLTAVSRARERLLVTAVRSEDEQPSVYLDLVDPLDDEADRDFAPVPRPATLPGVVAELRRELVSGTDEQREVAAAQLARLAAEEVRGADPAAWWALTDVSDDRPLRPVGAVVSVSPSRIEGFADCGLRWLLVTCGGDGPDQGAANIGTLIHDIAAELDDVDEPTLAAEVEARWSRLGLPDSWVSRKQKSEALEMVGRLARYYREARKEGWQRAGTELDLQVQLGRALLRGRVDRIETHPEHGVRVIDLKTGGRKPPADDLPRHPQLGAYQVAIEHGAFEEAGDVSAGAALLQIGKASLKNTTLQEQDPLARGDDPAWAEELVLETAEGMAAPTVLATIGDGCTRCPVRTSCPLQPEGRAI
uniref:PD-(D/E)XK nuclease family protein n=1 Tax=Segeticoccus rhizosphaerae TaxID=1104777 RepID=UPI0019399EC2